MLLKPQAASHAQQVILNPLVVPQIIMAAHLQYSWNIFVELRKCLRGCQRAGFKTKPARTLTASHAAGTYNDEACKSQCYVPQVTTRHRQVLSPPLLYGMSKRVHNIIKLHHHCEIQAWCRMVEVQELLRKMVLTGMLIYVPVKSRPP